MTHRDTTPSQVFIDTCRHHLSEDYLPKIRRSLEHLPDRDLWWRPNAESNSVGNLLLHLAGNMRQWVVSGIGGSEDVRERPREFAATGAGDESALGRTALLSLLEVTLTEVDEILESLSPDELLEPRTIQGKPTTVLESLFHAVEHFSMHTGQIIYIAKLRSGSDLRFYEVKNGIPRKNW